jgi:hypothetical protein
LARIDSLVVATLAAAFCAACSGSTTSPPPTSSPQPSASSSATTPPVPPYLAAYSEAEREAYGDAVAAYSQFVEADQRFAAAGKTSKDAARFYRRHSIDWVRDWATLAQLANNGVTITGAAATVWLRPADIALNSGGGDVVVLRRCVDSSGLVVMQNGQEIEQPNLKEPHVFRVRIERNGPETWWRTGAARQGKPC